MYAFLKGKIINKSDNSLIIRVVDIGYEVFVTSGLLSSLNINDEIEIYTHFHVREDHQTLYGFATLAERRLFRQLISVSGVGPKTALAMLGAVSINEIIMAVQNQDHNVFITVPGIGNKTAQRLILELKNKLDFSLVADSSIDQPATPSIRGDVLAALEQLGYSSQQVQMVLREIDLSSMTVEEAIKEVLRRMSNNKGLPASRS